MSVRFLLSAAAVPLFALGAALPAHAQDTPWSGFYAGVNAGAAWGNTSQRMLVGPHGGAQTDVTLNNASSLSDSTKTGFNGGVEGGYNYLAGPWLFGIETEWGALNVNDRSTANFQSPLLISPPISYQVNQRAKSSWLFTLRPRVGYVSGPWLFYGTAGLATSDVKVHLDIADTRTPQTAANSDSSKSLTGWTAGLGAGYALNDKVSIKGEWLYVGLGSIRTTITSADNAVDLTSRTRFDTNVARVGIDYRF